MKKRNVKSLKLRKNSISNLENNQIKGGTNLSDRIKLTDTCTSYIDACPSAWVCPTDTPWLCTYPF